MSTSTSAETSTGSVTTGKSTTERRHVVVIGAGYAGMNATLRAGKATRGTLIAPEDRFLNRVRQHEVAAGHSEHRPTFEHQSRGRDVTRIQARVTELDLAGHKVFTDTGIAFEVPGLAAEAGLAVGETGRALVDSRLRSVSHQDVYVVGDAASATVEGIGRLASARLFAGRRPTALAKDRLRHTTASA